MNKIKNMLLLFLFLVIYISAFLPKLVSKYSGVQYHTFASSIKLGNYGSGELWFILFFGFMFLSIQCHNTADCKSDECKSGNNVNFKGILLVK